MQRAHQVHVFLVKACVLEKLAECLLYECDTFFGIIYLFRVFLIERYETAPDILLSCLRTFPHCLDFLFCKHTVLIENACRFLQIFQHRELLGFFAENLAFGGYVFVNVICTGHIVECAFLCVLFYIRLTCIFLQAVRYVLDIEYYRLCSYILSSF